MPVVFLEVPPGIRTDAKKVLVQKLTNSIEEVYPIGETLIFFREYPLDMVAENGGLQSENPEILEAVEKTKSA
jgi:phenylpyruvate tautomerase PptA (4-oxalocrotonate tautomerase family)